MGRKTFTTRPPAPATIACPAAFKQPRERDLWKAFQRAVEIDLHEATSATRTLRQIAHDAWKYGYLGAGPR